MSFTIVKYPNEPIIVQTFNEDYDYETEMPVSNPAIYSALDSVSEENVYLIDVFNFDVMLDDIIRGASTVARGEKSLWHHPKLKQVILVTRDETLRMAAAGMSAKTFGALQIPVFETLEEALVYARAN